MNFSIIIKTSRRKLLTDILNKIGGVSEDHTIDENNIADKDIRFYCDKDTLKLVLAIISDNTDYIQTFNFSVLSPTSRKIKNLNSQRKKKIRARIYKRDKGVCQICFTPLSLEEFTLDHHPIKRRDGGKAVFSNLRMACEPCNFLNQ